MDRVSGCSGLSEKAEDERNSTGEGGMGSEAPKPLYIHAFHFSTPLFFPSVENYLIFKLETLEHR